MLVLLLSRISLHYFLEVFFEHIPYSVEEVRP